MAATSSTIEAALKNFLPDLEGFSPIPVWDYKQWSWGYGTAAGYDRNKKPDGSITKEAAWLAAMRVVNSHYEHLRPFITIELKPQQWAALLSFSYNLGPGNADNLAKNINTKDDAALIIQWKKYIYAGGVKNDGLERRRNKEIALWFS